MCQGFFVLSKLDNRWWEEKDGALNSRLRLRFRRMFSWLEPRTVLRFSYCLVPARCRSGQLTFAFGMFLIPLGEEHLPVAAMRSPPLF